MEYYPEAVDDQYVLAIEEAFETRGYENATEYIEFIRYALAYRRARINHGSIGFFSLRLTANVARMVGAYLTAAVPTPMASDADVQEYVAHWLSNDDDEWEDTVVQQMISEIELALEYDKSFSQLPDSHAYYLLIAKLYYIIGRY